MPVVLPVLKGVVKPLTEATLIMSVSVKLALSQNVLKKQYPIIAMPVLTLYASVINHVDID